MNMLKRCITLLKNNGVLYSHSIHHAAYTARDTAAAERVPAHSLVKTVVYYGDNGYGLLVLPADFSVDFSEVCRLLGLNRIRLAEEAELAALFPECEVGAMPPFGNLFDLPVLVDESLAAEDYMAFAAGTHRDVLRVSSDDYHKLVNPLVASFGFREVAAR
jgi:Ala-tRNA(Pro) deacylase